MLIVERILRLALPLTSPLLALLILFLAPYLIRKVGRRSSFAAAAAVTGLTGILVLLYHVLAMQPRIDRWLSAINSPLCAVFLVIVLPAMYLPRNRRYALFLILPAALVVVAVVGVYAAYRDIPPEDSGFHWFLIRPTWLMAGAASAMVLIQPLVRVAVFRRMVRLVCFLVLVYGGFSLRQDYADYRKMEGRRAAGQDIMNLSETTPVVRDDRRMLHLPSAPCRFAVDGGYVQGCNVELFQRLLQVNFLKARHGDPSEVNALGVLLASLLLFTVMCFLTARWFCGWACPLSSMGNVLNWVRVRAGLSPIRPAPSVKLSYLLAGLSLSGVTSLMAATVPYLDADGKFAGCKIPIFPMCKICPNQQLCPVAGAGLGAYPALPATEWAFGFFRYGCIVVLVLFLASFLAARRLWCRFCPMGMISGIFNRGGLFTLRKNPAKCNGCGMCAETCPMDIALVRDEMINKNVSSYHCVLCLQCVEKCPRDGCLSLEHCGVKVTESRFERNRP